MIRILRVSHIVFFLTLFMFWGSIQAQAVPIQSEQQKVQITYEEPQKTETPSVFWMVIQMLVALLVILALAWGLIRLLGKGLNSRMQGQWIRVLDEVTLGTNRGMVVIEVGGKAFLIGVTDHQISMLVEIDDPQLIKEMTAAVSERNSSLPFKSGEILEQIRNLRPTRAAKEPNSSFEKIINQKIHKLDDMSDRIKKMHQDSSHDDRYPK